MRIKIASALLMFSSLSYASDVDQFVKKYNKIFDGQTSVCDSNKAPSADQPGYHVAEATKLDGSKEILRVPQNFLGQLKKTDGKIVAEFHSYRWDKNTKKSNTEKSLLKIEETKEGIPRLNMYNRDGLFQAGHAIAHADDGSVAFLMAEITPDELDAKTSRFYLYVIRASKTDGVINYGVNDVIYDFPKEVRERAEEETGKKFFSDKRDENNTKFLGNSYSVEEVRELAKKYGVEAKETGVQPWQNCPSPTEDEIRAVQGNFAKTSKATTDKRKPSSLSPKKKK